MCSRRITYSKIKQLIVACSVTPRQPSICSRRTNERKSQTTCNCTFHYAQAAFHLPPWHTAFCKIKQLVAVPSTTSMQSFCPRRTRRTTYSKIKQLVAIPSTTSMQSFCPRRTNEGKSNNLYYYTPVWVVPKKQTPSRGFGLHEPDNEACGLPEEFTLCPK